MSASVGTALPQIGASRVERAFAFVDLSGFTAYTERLGDDRAVDLLAEFRSVVRRIAGARGVRVAKWLGDGAMLVAVETEVMVEAIVDISEAIRASGSPLPLRAGVAAGPVLLFEGDDYIGRSVNLAARLCDRARPYQILAPASVVSSLLVNTDVVPIGAEEIPGFNQPVDLVALGRVPAGSDGAR